MLKKSTTWMWKTRGTPDDEGKLFENVLHTSIHKSSGKYPGLKARFRSR